MRHRFAHRSVTLAFAALLAVSCGAQEEPAPQSAESTPEPAAETGQAPHEAAAVFEFTSEF